MNYRNCHALNPSILRAYDIRGIVNETIFPENARTVGRCFAQYIRKRQGKCVALARDGRLSSFLFQQQVQEGLLEEGINVVLLEEAPTPMLYYAVKSTSYIDGGLIVTGSHNPSTHNGFKMLFKDRPLFSQEIQDFAKYAKNFQQTSVQKGQIEFIDFKSNYIRNMLKQLNIPTKNIVWDPGHGVMASVLPELVKHLPGYHTIINGTIDGNFPSHPPDPAIEENLIELKQVVLEKKADLGIAFDGDGDRIGVIDDKGRMVSMDILLLLLAEDLLQHTPGATIISEVKTSQYFYNFICDLGGKGVKCRTGHSHIKLKMQETGAEMAGEMSGHFFFADNYGYDDGLYAALKVIQLLSKQEKLSSKINEYPPLYKYMHEIDWCDSKKFLAINYLINLVKQTEKSFCTIDGIRVEEPNLGWWLIRPSNTQAKLVCVAEGYSSQTLKQVIQQMDKSIDIIKRIFF